jgi:hypothetical protein
MSSMQPLILCSTSQHTTADWQSGWLAGWLTARLSLRGQPRALRLNG